MALSSDTGTVGSSSSGELMVGSTAQSQFAGTVQDGVRETKGAVRATRYLYCVSITDFRSKRAI